MASAPAFLHNGRLALASGPALVLLADFGSTVLLNAGALALIACYLLSAFGQAGASFTTLWLCVGVGAACYGASAFFVFGASIRALGLATLSTSLILLIGLWGTLQFRPFARHQRSLAAFCEEALFALLPLPGAAIPTWGFTALVGARDSPWVLLTALAAQYALLSGDVRPSFPSLLPPVFDTGGEVAAGGQMTASANARQAACEAAAGVDSPARPPPPRAAACPASAAAVHAAVVLCLPPLYFVALHHSTLDRDGSCRELQLLVSAAAAVVSGLPTRHIARWASSTLLRARELTLMLAMASLAHASANAYLAYTYPEAHGEEVRATRWLLAGTLVPPWLLLLLHRLRAATATATATPLALLVISTLSLVCGACACTLYGVPVIAQCVALVGALGALRFIMRPTLAPFVLATAAATLLLERSIENSVGFMREHAMAVSGLRLRALSWAMVVMCVLCAVALGCTLLRRAAPLRSASLLAHAAILAAVELSLLAESNAAADPLIYPPAFVLLSLGTGLFISARLLLAPLRGAGELTAHLSWLLLAAHAGRLAFLLPTPMHVPPANGRPLSGSALSGSALGTAALLASATLLSASLFQPLHLAALARAGASPPRAPAALARILLLFASLCISHARLLPAVVVALAPPGVPSGAPSVLALAIGLFALCCPPLCAPLAPPIRVRVEKSCSLGLVAAALFAALQPPLKPLLLLESIAWTALHPTASLSFGGTPRLLLWPPWLVLVITLGTLAAALGLLPLERAPPLARMVLAAAAGAGAALCACGALVPLERSLFLLHAAAGALAAPLLLLALYPQSLRRASIAPPALAFGLLLALTAVLPLGVLVQRRTFAHAPRFATPDAYHALWLSQLAGSFCLLGFILRLQLSRLIASAHAPGRRARGGVPTRGAELRSRSAHLAIAHRRTQLIQISGLEWISPVGNLSILIGFLVLYALQQESTRVTLGGGARGSLVFSPLFLLLQPHPLILQRLDDSNRYAPVCVAICAAVAVAAARQLLGRALSSPLAMVRGAALLGCALPSQLLCCQYLWDGRHRAEFEIWGALPLSLLPAILSSSLEIRDAGVLGLLAGLVHVALSRRARDKGLRYL